MDDIFKNIERFSLEASSDQSFIDVASLSADDMSLQYYTVYKAAQELIRYKIFNNSLKLFYIYFSKSKIVIAPGTVNDQQTYYDIHLASKDSTVEQWKSLMEKTYRGSYMVMPFREDSVSDSLAIGFVRSVSTTAYGDAVANMVILFNLNDILDNNGNGAANEGNVLVMDSNGDILSGNEMKKALPDLDYQELKGEHGSLSKTFEKKKMIVSYTTSQVNGLKYITITQESVFWEKAQMIRNIMAGGLLICFALGGFLAFFFLRKNYNPLKEIVAYFKEKVHTEAELESNEYGFIQQAFSKTLEQKEIIRLKLEQQNKALKSNFIAALLKGRETSAPIQELMGAYDISFKYSHFTVMAIYIKYLNEDFWEGYPSTGIQKYGMSRFIITNVIEELINRSYCGYMSEVDDMLVCLINMDCGGDYKTELRDLADEAKAFLEQNYRIGLDFAVGSPHESFEGIPDAFMEALNAMEYIKVLGISHTVFYDETTRNMKNYYYYPVEKEYLLINCIKTADFKAAADILEDIFQKNFVNNKPSLQVARCLMFELNGTMFKTVNQLEKINNEGFYDDMNIVDELMNCGTISEIKNKMLEIIKRTCCYIEKNTARSTCKIRETVIEIIKRNYSDPNLGIASIAEQMDKPLYLVSRTFREQTNEGILDYINKVRVSKAKELLKENSMTHNEIAEKVGYTNTRTFYRIFKKLEGIPPGKC